MEIPYGVNKIIFTFENNCLFPIVAFSDKSDLGLSSIKDKSFSIESSGLKFGFSKNVILDKLSFTEIDGKADPQLLSQEVVLVDDGNGNASFAIAYCPFFKDSIK